MKIYNSLVDIDNKSSAHRLILEAEDLDDEGVLVLLRNKFANDSLHIGKALLVTLEYIQEIGSVTASELCEKFDLRINNAGTRLNRLFNLGLLSREERKLPNGREYVYIAK